MRRIAISSALFLAFLLTGCAVAPDTVVFVTKTSIGVDAESTTPGMSIAYDRVEGYVAPRYETNKIPAVYASFNSNGEVYNRDVRHVYATGKAAKIISANQAKLARLDSTNNMPMLANAAPAIASTPEGSPIDHTKPTRLMFFGTSTTIGLKVSPSTLGGDNFVFGIKRKEMSIIPTVGDPDNFPSVIALFTSDLAHKEPAKLEERKGKNILDIRQFFATGVAADEVANDPLINYRFYIASKGVKTDGESAKHPVFVDTVLPANAPPQASIK